MYIAPGQGQTAPRGQNFHVNRKALSLYPFVASFKEVSLTSDFIQFFSWLIYVYSPVAGGIKPPGDKVLMSTEASCHFSHLLLVSNHRWQWFLKNPLFYHFTIISLWEKIRVQWRITPKWIIQSDPNSNSFELVCLISLPASLTKIQ